MSVIGLTSFFEFEFQNTFTYRSGEIQGLSFFGACWLDFEHDPATCREDWFAASPAFAPSTKAG
jgi:hypothetical protein